MMWLVSSMKWLGSCEGDMMDFVSGILRNGSDYAGRDEMSICLNNLSVRKSVILILSARLSGFPSN